MSMSDRSGRNGLRQKDFSPLKILDERGRSCVLEALPNAILTVSREGLIEDVNAAAESFFELGKPLLIGQKISRLLPFGSPLITLIQHVRDRGAAINEYKVDLGRPGQEGDRRVDVHCAPLSDTDGLVLVVLQERTIADKIDRQLSHRGAVRSVSGLASMLAHEIKNPLSGIRGAAQLLESGRQRRRSGADAADLRGDGSHRSPRRPYGGLLGRAAAQARAGQYPFRARSREAGRADGLCAAHPIRRELRPLASAGPRQSRPARPGVPQSREERRRGDRRRCGGRRDRTFDGVPAWRQPARHGRAAARSVCRSNSACATTAPAFPKTSPRISSTLLSPRSLRELASVLHWWPRSLMTMAALLNANPFPGARLSES